MTSQPEGGRSGGNCDDDAAASEQTAMAIASSDGRKQTKLKVVLSSTILWRREERERGCACASARRTRCSSDDVCSVCFNLMLYNDDLAPGLASDSVTEAQGSFSAHCCVTVPEPSISLRWLRIGPPSMLTTPLPFWLVLALTLQLGKRRQNTVPLMDQCILYQPDHGCVGTVYLHLRQHAFLLD